MKRYERKRCERCNMPTGDGYELEGEGAVCGDCFTLLDLDMDDFILPDEVLN